MSAERSGTQYKKYLDFYHPNKQDMGDTRLVLFRQATYAKMMTTENDRHSLRNSQCWPTRVLPTLRHDNSAHPNLGPVAQFPDNSRNFLLKHY